MPDAPRTAAASEAHRQYAAERAVNDPIKLDRATRIVRLAIARDQLSIEDLVGASVSGAAS